MQSRSAVVLPVVNLALVLVSAGAGIWVVLRLFSWPEPDVERHRRLAATLEANKLYDQAQAAYETYRSQAGLSPAEDANLHFHQAELCETKLGDRPAALAHYLMAKELNPQAEWTGEAEKRIVALLEGMGRSLDAQNRLTEATALEPGKAASPGQVVAKLGQREITMAELDQAIQELPPETQKQFAGPAGKRQFLDQYLLEQMLYDAAARQGLAERAEVKQKLEAIRRNLLAQMAYAEEMRKRLKITPEEMGKYMAEHKDKAKNKEEAVKQLQQEKEAQARQVLFEELRKLQDIKIYEDAFGK